MDSITQLKAIKVELENVIRMLNSAIHVASDEDHGSKVGRDPIPLTPAYDTRSIMSTVSVNKHIQDATSQVLKHKSPSAVTTKPVHEDFNDVFANLSHLSART